MRVFGFICVSEGVVLNLLLTAKACLPCQVLKPFLMGVSPDVLVNAAPALGAYNRGELEGPSLHLHRESLPAGADQALGPNLCAPETNAPAAAL